VRYALILRDGERVNATSGTPASLHATGNTGALRWIKATPAANAGSSRTGQSPLPVFDFQARQLLDTSSRIWEIADAH